MSGVIEIEEARLRNLPHNIQAEKGYLGAIFIERETTILDDTHYLKPEHFSVTKHAEIFAAIQNLYGNGMAIDPVILNNMVEEPGYLAELAACGVTPLNAKEYAFLIHDLWRRREIIFASQQLTEAAYSNSDTNELIDNHEAALAEIGPVDETPLGARPISVFCNQVLETLEKARETGGVMGEPTGFVDLDAMLGGLFPGDLFVLAGRPSMGKTALASNISLNMAGRGTPVLWFSVEMSGDQLAARETGAEAGVSSHQMRSGKVNSFDLDLAKTAGGNISKLPIFIDDRPSLSIQTVRAEARRYRRIHKIGLVVIDYLQLMNGKAESRLQEISAITRGAKAVAKELGVPVLALSQLSRKCEERVPPRPQLQDLRESGTIEQDADAVGLLYREEYYVDRKKPERRASDDDADFGRRMNKWQGLKDAVANKAEFIIAKQRHGPTGTIELHFDGAKTRFGNLEGREDTQSSF